MLSFTLKKRLRDFTLELSGQVGIETIALIGHSGCGKTTLLRLLAGLDTPDEGSISLDDKVLFDSSAQINDPAEVREMGYVLQNYALFPHLSVLDNIAYGIVKLDPAEREKRIQEAVRLLGLQKLLDQMPAKLSGGEQQRVALARALVIRPKLLLLDEPLSALDISIRSRVRTELKQLLKQLAIPTLIVTHDFEDARVLADRIAVMDRGVIIQSGSAEEIAQYPANAFVAQFIGTNLLPAPKMDTRQTWTAFDPWRARVSRLAQDSPYEWKGQIQDISRFGGFARLYLTAEQSWMVDVSIDELDRNRYEPGEWVYTQVDEADSREICSLQQSEQSDSPAESTSVDRKRSGTWKRAVVWSAVMLAVLSTIGTGFYKSRVKQPPGTSLPVFIAANATGPATELFALYKQKHPGVDIEATFAGTQILRTQIEQGAKVDFFLSADLANMQALQDKGVINRYDLVSNSHEVIVVPKENSAAIHSLQDLGSKPVRLVIGVDTVPIGKYTRQIFTNASADYGSNFQGQVLSHVVSYETDVKQVLQKVAATEAQAGIVYNTDVSSTFADKVTEIDIPDAYNVKAANYIAVPTNAPDQKLALDFLNFVQSAEGQAVFRKFGYDTPVQ